MFRIATAIVKKERSNHCPAPDGLERTEPLELLSLDPEPWVRTLHRHLRVDSGSIKVLAKDPSLGDPPLLQKLRALVPCFPQIQKRTSSPNLGESVRTTALLSSFQPTKQQISRSKTAKDHLFRACFLTYLIANSLRFYPLCFSQEHCSRLQLWIVAGGP